MMNVADIMTEQPTSIHRDAPLRRAFQLMRDLGCHHLPVISTDNHLIGILSERDCMMALNLPYTQRENWAANPQVDKIKVRAAMTPAPIIIEPYAPAEEAARLMLVNYIGCLPVMNSETLVGIVTRSDILTAFMSLSRQESVQQSACP